MDRTFIALVAAPVPVGHRVEVRVLVEKVGAFRRTEKEHIVVTDLDTGVVYGPMDAFEPISGIRVEPRPLPLTPRSDLAEASRTVGRVLACQVATMGFSELWLQTTLVVAEDA
jgi:hypothetical protein